MAFLENKNPNLQATETHYGFSMDSTQTFTHSYLYSSPVHTHSLRILNIDNQNNPKLLSNYTASTIKSLQPPTRNVAYLNNLLIINFHCYELKVTSL